MGGFAFRPDMRVKWWAYLIRTLVLATIIMLWNYSVIRFLGLFGFIGEWGRSGWDETAMFCLVCSFTANAVAMSFTVWGLSAAEAAFRWFLVAWACFVAVVWWKFALGEDYIRCLAGAALGAAIGSVFANILIASDPSREA